MQFGYSLLAGEMVPAADADYGDCAKQQITCPVCREPVFKGFRQMPVNVHYFSHYKGVADERNCELRVEALAKKHGMINGSIPHNQTLESFIGEFKNSIVVGYEKQTGVNIRAQIIKIMSMSYFEDVDIFDVIKRHLFKVPDVRADLVDLLNESPIFNSKSVFWKRRAASYILDALRHLETPPAKNSLRFLTAASLAIWPRVKLEFSVYRHDPWQDLINAMAQTESIGKIRHYITLCVAYVNTLADKNILQTKLKPVSTDDELQAMLGLKEFHIMRDVLRKKKEKLKQEQDEFNKLLIDLRNSAMGMHLAPPFLGLLALASNSFFKE